MNESEAIDVVTFIAAPYNRPVDPALVGTWYQAALQRVDVADAMDVAVELLNGAEFMPTPAHFNKMRDQLRREAYTLARNAEAGQQALPAADDAGSLRAKFASEARGMLTAQMATLGQHDHHGPDVCPVCGGVAPRVLDAMDQAGRDRCASQTAVIKENQRRRFGPRSW